MHEFESLLIKLIAYTVEKLFKYFIIAVDKPEDEKARTYEITLEEPLLYKVEDVLDLKIADLNIPFKITSIQKVNHINTPNDPSDYRLFAVHY